MFEETSAASQGLLTLAEQLMIILSTFETGNDRPAVRSDDQAKSA